LIDGPESPEPGAPGRRRNEPRYEDVADLRDGVAARMFSRSKQEYPQSTGPSTNGD